MNRAVVLSMLGAVVLSGCGGGGSGGGGGGSPTPVATKYNFQFVELVNKTDQTDPKCTLFDTDRQASGMESFAKVAEDVTVKVFDAKGDFVKLLEVSSKGILTLSTDDVPDDGYVSVIDSPSSSDHFYKVLSIQKSLLSNSIIAIGRNQGSVACYEGEKGSVVDKGFASVTLNGEPASTFAFDSSQTSFAAAAIQSQEIEKDKSEEVLVRAYESGDLVDYAFVPNLTKLANITPTQLSGVANSVYAWSIQLPVNVLDTLSIRLNKGDFSYPWLDNVDFVTATNTTTGFAYVAAESNWNYNAKGNSFNWAFEHNETLGASLDVNLPSELTLSDNALSVSQVGVNYEFQAPGISSTIKRLQRSSYERAPDAKNTLHHVIYSEVDAGKQVVIPKLELTSLAPAGASDIKVNILSSDSITSDLKTFFMRENAPKDLVSVVLSPAKTIAHDKTKYMSNYTLLSR